jgi:dTMP kinase
MLLNPGAGMPELEPRAEVLLFAAERAQHVEEVVRPALRAGQDVVCDRYIGSSVAYQGYGRGEDPHQPWVELSGVTPDWVYLISRWAADDLYPDLTVLLTVPAEARDARMAARGTPDRIERAGRAFHDRVEGGFKEQAKRDPSRWRAVDGSGTVDAVARRVATAVDAFFAIRQSQAA